MDADEKEICLFLKSYPGQFVGLREICRRAGGKQRFQEEEDWALPVLLRLAERGLVEDDRAGHFRLVRKEKRTEQKWIAPHLRDILKRSGKTFDVAEDEDHS
ncbi:MAG TPA: hypothetical protein VEH04_16515 [Verrucomicrobiae bacterium]|nr:hypothetical protein [Verrucomicrobiae bacterium]